MLDMILLDKYTTNCLLLPLNPLLSKGVFSVEINPTVTIKINCFYSQLPTKCHIVQIVVPTYNVPTEKGRN